MENNKNKRENEIARKLYEDVLKNIEESFKILFKKINKKKSNLVVDEETGDFYVMKDSKVVWSGDFLDILDNTWNGNIMGLSDIDQKDKNLINQYKNEKKNKN